MISRQRLSTVLFFLSTLLLMYGYWFEVNLSPEIMALSWGLMAMSRSIILFPNVKWGEDNVKLGKEIK